MHEEAGRVILASASTYGSVLVNLVARVLFVSLSGVAPDSRVLGVDLILDLVNTASWNAYLFARQLRKRF